jgi:diaminopimelate epimerase
MRMYNSDGSEGSMCGNAIRCVAKWLFDNEYVKNSNIQISTKSGIKTVVYDEKTSTAKVDMGKPTVLSKGFVNHIDVGNPHAVIFCNDVDGLDLDAIGPFFEKSSYFKNGVNTEFVQVIGRNHLKMRVWERGSGETMACGTGAVASATAAVLHDFCDEDKDIIVELGGGELVINITDDTAFLIGSATTVYTGDIEYEDK